MRVTLIHNEAAGDARSPAAVARALAAHGHTVVVSARPGSAPEALALDEVDLVVAAGGDGTIATTARALAGTSATLAVVPLGTANNIARALGVPRGTNAAIAAWPALQRRRLDLGIATGPWGERLFVESVGGGLLAHGMVVMDRREYTSPTTTAQLARARRAFLDVLSRLAPVRWTFTVDDERVDGEFLFVEALNIAVIGPALRLAEASPLDGSLTVVAAAPEHRAMLERWMRHGPHRRPPCPLATWRAREVRLVAGDRLHVDDAVLDAPAAVPPDIRVRLDPGALAVLAR
ncbi:MAG: diacylglycerol kinase family protein [Vicinamibacterales bacterium]